MCAAQTYIFWLLYPDGLLPGCYALQVTKDLPEEVESMLSNQNKDLYLRPFMENES